ncbi:MAG: Fic family protein, partial [Angustibacter sp.]
MRSFNGLEQMIGQVPASVVRKLRLIDVGRGTEALHRHQLPELLERLAERAKVASVKASSAIEGVIVADESRATLIAQGRIQALRGRNEQQLAGYRKAVDYLWQDDWGP